jgi:hypothetical protein
LLSCPTGDLPPTGDLQNWPTVLKISHPARN